MFVDETPAFVDAVMNEAKLDVAQIYGRLPDRKADMRVWQAIRMPEAGAGEWTPGYTEAILLDGPSNGVPFDWSKVFPLDEKIIIAGGLDASNVAEAIRIAQPWGVDASFTAGIRARNQRSPESAKLHRSRPESFMITSQPDSTGHFGPYGGRFVPEVLMAPLEELEHAYREASADPAFQAELADLLHHYAGRPTPLYYARRLSETLGGAKIYIKREDLLHTGAHKINNCLGQALLARRMGKKRIIAETGAGQHGVATATVCALFGLDCTVYMGEEDMRRQSLNVFRMRMLGSKVVSVDQRQPHA